MGTTETATTPDFDSVMSEARRWYYSEVRSIVDEAIAECRRDHADDSPRARREAITEWVDQTTDGHEYIIYTAKAWMVLAASDKCDAAEESMGEEARAMEIGARACWALRADVWDVLEARSDEWEDWEPADPEVCADCGGSTAVGTPDPHVCMSPAAAVRRVALIRATVALWRDGVPHSDEEAALRRIAEIVADGADLGAIATEIAEDGR
jgi:hypothetical protein